MKSLTSKSQRKRRKKRKEKMKRPIAPYLSVYKPEITSIFSIGERVTGLLLVLVIFLGVILLKLEALLLSNYWFYSIFYFIFKSNVSGVVIGGLVLFVLLSCVYHTVFGVRYLYWDRGYKLITMEDIQKYTPKLMGVTVIITLIIWLFFLR